MSITITAFYKFVSVDDRDALREWLAELTEKLGIMGTVLVAHEGINGTISGTEDSIRSFLFEVRSDPRFSDLVSKESYSTEHPFRRLRIRLRPEIVTIGTTEADPTAQVGTYVKPEDWNAVISDPDVVLIDTRNDYEVAIGTFKGAVDPKTESFGEFPEYVSNNLDPARHKKVAMFCTGGIRCEKASSYMLSKGFEKVYHLEGGILKYLETVPDEESMWEGECFVFDKRVAVVNGVKQGSYVLCAACGNPLLDPNLATDGNEVDGINCPHCETLLTDKTIVRQKRA